MLSAMATNEQACRQRPHCEHSLFTRRRAPLNRLGRDRVMEFQYVAKLRERIRFDKLSFTFRVNRSMAISNFITSIKEQGILFPVWEEFKPFAKDILGIYVDYNERMKTMYYDHPIDQPDDAMHSIIYARLAGLISLGKY